ncbi:MAG: ASCH domain-containing protein [Planctomycetota bacterium]
MLLFKKKFLPAIRAGQKTQTIRLWPWRRMRAGQRSYIPGIGYITIEAVTPVSLEQLTDEDAVPDGFESAAELRKEIESIYADKLDLGYEAFRIAFRILEQPVESLVSQTAAPNGAGPRRTA